MTTGHKRAELNVTPLIDVLLVLLVIFMVTVPNRSVGLNTAVPQEPPSTERGLPNPLTVVVTAAENGSLAINSNPVSTASLARS